MNNLYKTIRLMTKMPQEQFAKELGTTPLSVNRWENGHSEPNKMAQAQLQRFCVERSLDIGQEIVRAKESLKGDNIFYHGSRRGIAGNIAPVSRVDCDFGKGFYMGTGALQPLTLICAEEKPKLYTLSFAMEGLRVLDFAIDLQWAMLIAYCRGEMDYVKGSAIYEKYSCLTQGYDVVTGYIADDRMYTVLGKFFHGDITDVALLHCLSALDLGKQVVAISEKACSRITVLREEAISPLECAILADMNMRRRKEGIRLADEAAKRYRREGRYFDEIVGG